MSNISRGVFNFFDSIGDFFIGTAGEIGSWFGADTEWAENAIKYDWVSQANEALSVLNVYDVLSGDVFTEDYWSDYANVFSSPEQAQFRAEKRRQGSFVSDASEKFQSGFKNVTEGIGELLPSLAVAAVTGGASLGAQAAIQGGIAVAKSGGQSMESALNEGANFHGAVKYGAVKGTISGIITAATVGIGGSVLSGGEGFVSKGAQKIGEAVGKVFSNSATAEVIAGKTAEIFMRAGIDAGRAGAQSLLDPVLKQITYDSDAIQKAYGSDEAIQNTLANVGNVMIQAGVTSAILSAGKEIVNGAKSGSFDKYKENYFVNKETRSDQLKAQAYKKEYDKLCKEYYEEAGLSSGKLLSKDEFVDLSMKFSDKIEKLGTKYNISEVLKRVSTNKSYDGTAASKYADAIQSSKQEVVSTLSPRAISHTLPKAIAYEYIKKSGWKPSSNEETSGNTTFYSDDGYLKLTYNNEDGSSVITTPNNPNSPVALIENKNHSLSLSISSPNQAVAMISTLQKGYTDNLPSTFVYKDKTYPLTTSTLKSVVAKEENKDILE